MGWKVHDLPQKYQKQVLGADGCSVQLAQPAEQAQAVRSSFNRESDLHDYILDVCRARGWLAIHSRMDRPTTTALGVSDFIIVTPKTVCFVEAKRKGGKPTPKQRGFLAAVGALGWPNAIVHSQEEFEEFLKKVLA